MRTKDNFHEMHESVILCPEEEETVDGTELRRLVSAFNRENDAYFLRLVQLP